MITDGIRSIFQVLEVILDFFRRFSFDPARATFQEYWEDMEYWLDQHDTSLPGMLLRIFSVIVGIFTTGVMVTLLGAIIGSTSDGTAAAICSVLLGALCFGAVILVFSQLESWTIRITLLIVGGIFISLLVAITFVVGPARTIILAGLFVSAAAVIPCVIILATGSRLADLLFHTGKFCAEVLAEAGSNNSHLSARLQQQLEKLRGSESRAKLFWALAVAHITMVLVLLIKPDVQSIVFLISAVLFIFVLIGVKTIFGVKGFELTKAVAAAAFALPIALIWGLLVWSVGNVSMLNFAWIGQLAYFRHFLTVSTFVIYLVAFIFMYRTTRLAAEEEAIMKGDVRQHGYEKVVSEIDPETGKPKHLVKKEPSPPRNYDSLFTFGVIAVILLVTFFFLKGGDSADSLLPNFYGSGYLILGIACLLMWYLLTPAKKSAPASTTTHKEEKKHHA